jgi:glycosyltransferase involved in cell wall biosynthesis
MKKNINSLVSIIIPVYNGEEYIARCINSVLAQTYENIEVLLINDGSTDKSGLICDIYSQQYDHIQIFHTLNCGPAAARNIGIKNCNGDVIYFLDIDDNIESTTIELLVAQYEGRDIDLVIGDFYRIIDGIKSTSGNELTFVDDCLLGEDDILSYVRKYFKTPYKFILFNHIWNRLFKTEIIKNNNILFNPDLRNLEDVDFNFKYLNYVKRAFFKKIPFYNYTIRRQSQSFVIGDDLNDVTKYPQTFNTIKTFLRARSVSELDIEKEIGHLFISYTIIILIRLCGSWNFKNSYKIYRNVAAIIRAPEVRKNLLFYSPNTGDIKSANILIKYKLTLLIMVVCCIRYKKHRNFSSKA